MNATHLELIGKQHQQYNRQSKTDQVQRHHERLVAMVPVVDPLDAPQPAKASSEAIQPPPIFVVRSGVALKGDHWADCVAVAVVQVAQHNIVRCVLPRFFSYLQGKRAIDGIGVRQASVIHGTHGTRFGGAAALDQTP